MHSGSLAIKRVCWTRKKCLKERFSKFTVCKIYLGTLLQHMPLLPRGWVFGFTGAWSGDHEPAFSPSTQEILRSVAVRTTLERTASVAEWVSACKMRWGREVGCCEMRSDRLWKNDTKSNTWCVALVNTTTTRNLPALKWHGRLCSRGCGVAGGYTHLAPVSTAEGKTHNWRHLTGVRNVSRNFWQRVKNSSIAEQRRTVIYVNGVF